MNFTFCLSGCNQPLIKEYEIDENTKITAGEAVGISGGKAVIASESDDILGVSAETHSGKEELLNARANGNKLRVIISPDAVYTYSAPKYTAMGGTATTITVASAGLSVNVSSGYAVLVSKALGSQNTDKIGEKRKISACSVSGANAVLTLENGGSASAGDVYMLFPLVGEKVQLDTDGVGFCFFRNDYTCKFTCVFCDYENGILGAKFDKTIFA